MKNLSLILLICLYLVSCKKDPIIDYCGEAVSEFKGYSVYEGEISFCNAQPPLMSFIPGVATTTFLDSNTLQIHLVADSINFDTVLVYDFQCEILEDKFPSISLNGETVNDNGYYSQDDFFEDFTAIIHFSFGYTNCLNNTGFDGLSK